MLVEERSYALRADASPQKYLEAYREMGMDIQKKTLGGLIGYYVVEVGDINTIVSLWRYASFEDRQARRQALAASPQWQAYLGVVRPMIQSMSNKLMSQVVEP